MAIEQGERRAPPIPHALLAQARTAARSGVGLDTVLRRYFAGYALLRDLLVEEAGGADSFEPSALRRLLSSQAALFDRLLAAISEEYERESSPPETAEGRRIERVRRLLAGELLDTADLAYDFDAVHLGVVAIGPGARQEVRDLAGRLGHRLLIVHPDRKTVWCWLAARNAPDPATVAALCGQWPANVTVALGEPAQGLRGWRLTHRQAAAALPIARRRRRAIRYAEVALLVSAFKDDLLATTLRQLYLAPLQADPDGGKVARETLCAYFAAGHNVSSAAAALGVSRRTVATRLRTIEERLGHKLEVASAELEVALHLAALGTETVLPRAM